MHGESGLRSWGNGNLHNEDEREREKLRKCRPNLLKKYMDAVREAISQNHKAAKDRYFVNISESSYDYQDKDGENDIIIMDDIKSLRCEICHSLYDDAMMLICDECEKAVHIYCSAYPLPDNFDMLEDDSINFEEEITCWLPTEFKSVLADLSKLRMSSLLK